MNNCTGDAIGSVKISQTSDATGQRAPSFISESDSDMDEDEAEKLAERVLHLEADLRRSEMTIQGLQQELAATKLAQTPTTDTQRYQLGGGARGQRSTPPQEVPRSVEELAAIVTETSVAKGQVEIVRGSLADSQHELLTLQDKLALETEKTQALQETITVLNGQLNLCYAELHSKQQEVMALRSDRVGRGGGEVAVVQELKMRVKSEQEEGERLRTQNETLQEEVERLKTELRSEGRGTPTTPHFLRPGSPSGEDQKVRMLTVIALVSIGVALASWLA
jgi:chromosome segregation ATPase